jgi:pyruvate dehydrogenase E1 component alpha subunit
VLLYWGGDERGNDFSVRRMIRLGVPIATQALHAAGAALVQDHARNRASR